MGYIGKPQSADPITVNTSNITDGSIQAVDISSSFREAISGSITESSSSFSTRVTATEASGALLDGDGTVTFGSVAINTTSTDAKFVFTATEDSSTAAPVIDLKRNSSSPADADYLGQIKFKGENDADQEVVYAKVTGKIQDASDGTEDGIIEFANKKAGSNVITARLRSDSLQLLNSTNLSVAGTTSLTGTLDVTGVSTFSDDVTVQGTLTAQEIHTEFTSASIIFTSGSTIFGDTSDDVHSMTGSLNVSGAINLNDGDLIVTDSVGIATDNPQKILHTASNGIRIDRGGGGSYWDIGPDGTNHFKFVPDGGTEVARIETGGNVGIGTASPGHLLTVAGATDGDNPSIHIIAHSSDSGSIWFGESATNKNGGIEYDNSGQDMYFTTNSSRKMTLDTSGNLGIGVTTPGYLTELRVNDTVTDTPRLVIRQLGTGDSSLAFQMPDSPYGWVMGADNSDSDRFKISTGVGDVDSSPRFEIDPGGTTIHRYTGAENIVQIHSGVGSSTTGVSQIYFSSKDQYGGNTHQSYIKSTIDGSSSTPATKMTFHNRDSSGTVQEYLTIQADGDVVLTNSLYMAGGSTGRLHFNNHRFLEGATNASLLRIGEDYTATTIYGKVGIGESSPETSAGLTINQGGNDDKILSLKTTDLAHGVTTVAETDTFGYMKKFSNTQGGLEIGGVTSHERPIVMRAYGNYYQSPSNGTGTDKCAVQMWVYENSGTGVTNVGSNESIFTVRVQKGGSMQSVFIVDTEGDLHADGSTSITGYDYAEYFEWTDGNPDNEDRVGYSVVLDGDKIRKATEGETPIGIISGTPAVVGDNPMNWHGTWKTDEWGRKINKEVEWVRWEYDYQPEEGAEVVKKEQNWKVSDLPEDLEIPDNAEYYTDFEGQYSDDYDPSQSYTLREYRQEWSAVGLMGKLRLRKGQPVASTWIKMRDEGNNIEMWLVK